MTPRDTSVGARRRQMDLYRAMTPQDRLRLAATMTDEIRAIAEAGRRSRADPDPGVVPRALRGTLLDPDLYR